jgi:hypothetical protein
VTIDPTSHLHLWEPGGPGRGFLLRAGREYRLLLWEVDEIGRPFHSDVVDMEDLAQVDVLASLLIEPDGRTTAMPWGPGSHIECGAQAVALDERLHEVPELLEGWEFA